MDTSSSKADAPPIEELGKHLGIPGVYVSNRFSLEWNFAAHARDGLREDFSSVLKDPYATFLYKDLSLFRRKEDALRENWKTYSTRKTREEQRAVYQNAVAASTCTRLSNAFPPQSFGDKEKWLSQLAHPHTPHHPLTQPQSGSSAAPNASAATNTTTTTLQVANAGPSFKPLQELAALLPHGFRVKNLLSVLYTNQVPMHRALWMVKLICVNQFGKGSSASTMTTAASTSLSSSASSTSLSSSTSPLSGSSLEKSISSPSFKWTEEVLAAILELMNQYKGVVFTVANSADTNFAAAPITSADEYVRKLRYYIRLLHCSSEEGLIEPALIEEWVFARLSDLQPTYSNQLPKIPLAATQTGASGSWNAVKAADIIDRLFVTHSNSSTKRHPSSELRHTAPAPDSSSDRDSRSFINPLLQLQQALLQLPTPAQATAAVAARNSVSASTTSTPVLPTAVGSISSSFNAKLPPAIVAMYSETLSSLLDICIKHSPLPLALYSTPSTLQTQQTQPFSRFPSLIRENIVNSVNTIEILDDFFSHGDIEATFETLFANPTESLSILSTTSDQPSLQTLQPERKLQKLHKADSTKHGVSLSYFSSLTSSAAQQSAGSEAVNSETLDSDSIIYTICEWACTLKRFNPHRPYAAAQLLLRYHQQLLRDAAVSEAGTVINNSGLKDDGYITNNATLSSEMKYPLQYELENFLLQVDKWISTEDELRSICKLFAELLRFDVLSHDHYVKSLISRGLTSSSSNSAAGSPTIHQVILQCLPIPTTSSLHVKNQRRVVLYGVKGKDDEDEIVEWQRHMSRALRLRTDAAESASPSIQTAVSEVEVDSVLNDLLKRPFYESFRVAEFIADRLYQHADTLEEDQLVLGFVCIERIGDHGTLARLLSKLLSSVLLASNGSGNGSVSARVHRAFLLTYATGRVDLFAATNLLNELLRTLILVYEEQAARSAPCTFIEDHLRTVLYRYARPNLRIEQLRNQFRGTPAALSLLETLAGTLRRSAAPPEPEQADDIQKKIEHTIASSLSRPERSLVVGVLDQLRRMLTHPKHFVVLAKVCAKGFMKSVQPNGSLDPRAMLYISLFREALFDAPASPQQQPQQPQQATWQISLDILAMLLRISSATSAKISSNPSGAYVFFSEPRWQALVSFIVICIANGAFTQDAVIQALLRNISHEIEQTSTVTQTAKLYLYTLQLFVNAAKYQEIVRFLPQHVHFAFQTREYRLTVDVVYRTLHSIIELCVKANTTTLSPSQPLQQTADSTVPDISPTDILCDLLCEPSVLLCGIQATLPSLSPQTTRSSSSSRSASTAAAGSRAKQSAPSLLHSVVSRLVQLSHTHQDFAAQCLMVLFSRLYMLYTPADHAVQSFPLFDGPDMHTNELSLRAIIEYISRTTTRWQLWLDSLFLFAKLDIITRANSMATMLQPQPQPQARNVAQPQLQTQHSQQHDDERWIYPLLEPLVLNAVLTLSLQQKSDTTALQIDEQQYLYRRLLCCQCLLLRIGGGGGGSGVPRGLHSMQPQLQPHLRPTVGVEFSKLLRKLSLILRDMIRSKRHHPQQQQQAEESPQWWNAVIGTLSTLQRLPSADRIWLRTVESLGHIVVSSGAFDNQSTESDELLYALQTQLNEIIRVANGTPLVQYSAADTNSGTLPTIESFTFLQETVLVYVSLISAVFARHIQLPGTRMHSFLETLTRLTGSRLLCTQIATGNTHNADGRCHFDSAHCVVLVFSVIRSILARYPKFDTPKLRDSLLLNSHHTRAVYANTNDPSERHIDTRESIQRIVNGSGGSSDSAAIDSFKLIEEFIAPCSHCKGAHGPLPPGLLGKVSVVPRFATSATTSTRASSVSSATANGNPFLHPPRRRRQQQQQQQRRTGSKHQRSGTTPTQVIDLTDTEPSTSNHQQSQLNGRRPDLSQIFDISTQTPSRKRARSVTTLSLANGAPQMDAGTLNINLAHNRNNANAPPTMQSSTNTANQTSANNYHQQLSMAKIVRR